MQRTIRCVESLWAVSSAPIRMEKAPLCSDPFYGPVQPGQLPAACASCQRVHRESHAGISGSDLKVTAPRNVSHLHARKVYTIFKYCVNSHGAAQFTGQDAEMHAAVSRFGTGKCATQPHREGNLQGTGGS